MTKELKLTQGKVALVDDEDFEFLNQWKWQWVDRYPSRVTLISETGVVRKRLYLHKVIMNTPKGMLCDHINHSTLDNRKENLRNCTNSENQRNRRIHKRNKSGYKGVSKHGTGWRVFVDKNNKHVFSKTYRDIVVAARAYDEKAKEIHGEFANLNFPEENK